MSTYANRKAYVTNDVIKVQGFTLAIFPIEEFTFLR